VDLFQNNDLSQVEAQLIPVCDQTEWSDLVSVLCAFLGPGVKAEQIFRIGSSHSISHKFLITLPSGKFFLKCRPGTDDADLFFREARVAEFLRSRGVKVPGLIRTRNGQYGCSLRGRHWLLFEFVRGRHFTGAGQELDSVAKVFGRFTRVIADWDEVFQEKNEGVIVDDLQTLLDLASRSRALNDYYVPEALSSHFKILTKRLVKAKTERQIVEREWAFMHTEFHPMNLLMNNEKVAAVLDFEDVNWCPVLAALGYNAYKLIRQMMTDPIVRKREMAHSTLVGRWLSGWRQSSPDSDWGPLDLGRGAIYRVLGLIRLILHRSLKLGDVEYAYDLEKQIYSLYEIDMIFGFSHKQN